MRAFIGRRLLSGVLLLIALTLVTFLLSELAPGDPFYSIRFEAGYSAEKLAELESRYGFDRPVWVRYGLWIRSIVAGEMGHSMVYELPVGSLIVPRLQNTLLLVAAAFLLSWSTALPLALVSTLRTHGVWAWARRLGDTLAATTVALPRLLLALAGIWLASWLDFLPLGGMHSLDIDSMNWLDRQLDLFRHLLVPAFVLALGWWPTVYLHARDAVQESLEEPYLRAALAHGIERWRWVLFYVLPAAANPLISLAGLSLAALVSGSLLVEAILGWPGMGPLLLEAILARDLHVVMASVLVSGVLLWMGQTLADFLLYLIDPRLRLGAES